MQIWQGTSGNNYMSVCLGLLKNEGLCAVAPVSILHGTLLCNSCVHHTALLNSSSLLAPVFVHIHSGQACEQWLSHGCSADVTRRPKSGKPLGIYPTSNSCSPHLITRWSPKRAHTSGVDQKGKGDSCALKYMAFTYLPLLEEADQVLIVPGPQG